MAIIMRHGGESHVVRPDRVYRTGVLTSMVGYQPQADVQAVAQYMTQGPPLGTMLSGLGAIGPLKRLGLRIKAALSRKQAGNFMAASGYSGLQGFGSGPPGPAPMAAMQVAPQFASQMTFLSAIMSRTDNAQGAVADASIEAAMRRNNTFYRAG